MAIRGAAVACLGFSSVAASIADGAPPAIDAAGYCRRVAEISGVKGYALEIVFAGCVKAEAIARSQIRRVWSDVPDVDRSACLTAMPATTPSNQGVADCVAASVAKRFLQGDLRFCVCDLRATLAAP
jgi:hypothetical protein